MLFAFFSAVFPGRFSGLFPNEKSLRVAKLTWQKALQDLTDAQLEQGKKACLNYWKDDFAISIPTFRKLILNQHPERTHHDAYKPLVRALPEPGKALATAETAQNALAGIRKILPKYDRLCKAREEKEREEREKALNGHFDPLSATTPTARGYLEPCEQD